MPPRSQQIRVLFVCRGNTCRSPMAEALARHVASTTGRKDLAFSSAGVAPGTPGSPADPRAVTCAAAHGVTIGAHASRAVANGDFERFDLLLALDASNEAELRRRAPAAAHDKIQRLMSFAQPPAPADVPDPYDGGPADYAQAWSLIARAIAGLLATRLG